MVHGSSTKYRAFPAGLSLVLVCVALQAASAQNPVDPVGGRSISRPTVSPYLNLLNNGGANPGLNYYNFVRPEQEFRRAATQLSSGLGNLQKNVTQLQDQQQPVAETPLVTGRMAPTGHAATFQSTGGYFPGSSGGQGSARFRRR